LARLPVTERLQRRIVDGEGKGSQTTSSRAAAEGKPAMAIINRTCWPACGSSASSSASQMQLPFVLQSAG
jgi:5-methyltetrahydrofolate--homocysteine methyltransferase